MKTSSLLAVLAACVFANPVLAQSTHVTVTERVGTAGLDLSRPADRSRLNSRIREAAFRACGEASSADLRGRNEVRRCRAETLRLAAAQADRAVAAVDRSATTIAALDE